MVRFYPKGSSAWSAVSEISHRQTDRIHQRPARQSPSFSSFNHDGQLQRRAVDEITTTQTTKPKSSENRLISFILLSLSLSVCILPLCLSISLFFSAVSLQSRIMHAGVFPASYKENLGAKTCVIPPKQIGMKLAVSTRSQRTEL